MNVFDKPLEQHSDETLVQVCAVDNGAAANELGRRLKVAHDLLLRAADHMADLETAPVGNWWKEYALLTGEHLILTEEGWEYGKAKAEYLKDDPDWKPLDEVNAPSADAT